MSRWAIRTHPTQISRGRVSKLLNWRDLGRTDSVAAGGQRLLGVLLALARRLTLACVAVGELVMLDFAGLALVTSGGVTLSALLGSVGITLTAGRCLSALAYFPRAYPVTHHTRTPMHSLLLSENSF